MSTNGEPRQEHDLATLGEQVARQREAILCTVRAVREISWGSASREARAQLDAAEELLR